jgi:hypothetical protein
MPLTLTGESSHDLNGLQQANLVVHGAAFATLDLSTLFSGSITIGDSTAWSPPGLPVDGGPPPSARICDTSGDSASIIQIVAPHWDNGTLQIFAPGLPVCRIMALRAQGVSTPNPPWCWNEATAPCP